MEIASHKVISKLFLKEPTVFSQKRDLKLKSIFICLGGGVFVLVIAILLLPSQKKPQKTFYEKSDSHTVAVPQSYTRDNNPTEDALAQLQSAKTQGRLVPDNLERVGSSSPPKPGSLPTQGSSMILARSGLDGKTQLPPGSKVPVLLDQAMTLENHSMPIIATVTKDVTQDDGLAIPQGSKLYGDASFDDNSERVQVNWKSIQLPNGQMKPFAGIGLGLDGQVGVEGDVHSDAAKNAVGQTVTRFIGAYAQGSMQTGAFGANPGGSDNGLKNAISQTAQDQANSWADNMKKERKWIDFKAGAQFFAIVTQPFQFRDPGNSYGR